MCNITNNVIFQWIKKIQTKKKIVPDIESLAADITYVLK